MRPDDGNPFNAGWNAASTKALNLIKALPMEKVADGGIHVLISKSAVLKILRELE